MRALRYLSALCTAPLLGSCMFLLDYDDLQKGEPVPTNIGDGGMQNAGGAPPVETCDTNCDDLDPCTKDHCQAGVCLHDASEGLALDGFETTLTAEKHLRLSLIGSGQFFYLSALETTKNTPKVSLYRLANDATMLDSIGGDLKLDGNPISNVGLAVEELAAGEVALHGFVATKLKLGDIAPHVVHVVSRNDKAMTNLVPGTYKGDNPTVFPQALNIGNKIVGAWLQADGTVGVHSLGSARTESYGDVSLPATSFALLSSADAQPAVMFTAQAESKKAIGTYVESAGHSRVRLLECETRPGDYLSSSVISTQIAGLWLADITRTGDDYLTTGGGTIACGSTGCTAIQEDCKKNPSPNALRNVAGATVHFDADAAGIVYSVVALPHIAVQADGESLEARLSLSLGKADFSTEKVVSSTIGGDAENGLLQVAQNATNAEDGFAGPDWPAVAILPSRHVAVAWIQPSPTTEGTELRIQRYKMCLPAP